VIVSPERVSLASCGYIFDIGIPTRQAAIGALISAMIVQTALQIVNYPDVWLGDFRFWTSILTIASLGVIFSIRYLEHTRLRNASGVVLFYWLFLLTAFGLKLRSLILQHVYEKHVLYFISFCLGFGLAGLEFVLE
jgi:ATP-binding cassette subfamily C (CFTR/MRP) protein 1